ncbi:MAG: SIMPL domain-containing protein [Novosphingobium sp.]
MRRVSALIAVLALSACGGRDHGPNPRGVDRDETLLSLSATGEAEAVPDLATIVIGVETFGADAKAANEANSRKAAEIIKALSAFGVADKDIQTANLSLNRIDYGPKKGQFQASNTLTVRLRDVPKAGEALAAATAAGANVVQGPSLQIDDPEKANRGAYIAAYRAARTRAEAYAEAAGMQISRVLTIRDGGQGGDVAWAAAEAADSAMAAAEAPIAVAPPPPSIRPGTSRTRVTVQVDFALEEK